MKEVPRPDGCVIKGLYMTRVKICGITNCEEIAFLNEYKPDYIGFVFAESKRRVTPEQAVSLAEGLDNDIKKVGVFVDVAPAYAAVIAETVGLDVLQLHGNEDSAYIKQLRGLVVSRTEIWKTFRIGPGHLPKTSELSSLGADRILLDTYVDKRPGGTGESFDWSLAAGLHITLPFILAGGLSPENIKGAIAAATPFAVDTSSGVEENGKKSEQRVKAFIRAVRM